MDVPTLVTLCALALFVLALAAAAASDIASMTIPDWTSIALAASFPLAALAGGAPVSLIGLHLSVGAGLFVLGAALFYLGVMGGGDVKLIAGVGVWTGLGQLPAFAAATALAGGALALCMLAARAGLAPRPAFPAFANRLLAKDNGVPYGVAIAVGGLYAAAQFPLVSRALGGLAH